MQHYSTLRKRTNTLHYEGHITGGRTTPHYTTNTTHYTTLSVVLHYITLLYTAVHYTLHWSGQELPPQYNTTRVHYTTIWEYYTTILQYTTLHHSTNLWPLSRTCLFHLVLAVALAARFNQKSTELYLPLQGETCVDTFFSTSPFTRCSINVHLQLKSDIWVKHILRGCTV